MKPETQTEAGSEMGSSSQNPVKVAILYRRNARVDEQVLELLETELSRQGCTVFTDRQPMNGMQWANVVSRQISIADAVVPIISANSIHSELMSYEIECAQDAAQTQLGRPQILPIRVKYTGPLPEPMASILDSLPYLLWEGTHDNLGLVTELGESLKRILPSVPPVTLTSQPFPGVRSPRNGKKPMQVLHSPVMEPVGGAVPLNSEFYVARPVDGELRQALERQDSIILIKGARQMGKTSLLARGLQFARDSKARVAMTDYQKLNASNLSSASQLYLALCESLAEQLDLAVSPADSWDERRGANINFERFLRREILAKMDSPLVWGMDEVDRLFGYPFGSEVFGLFRSWHNERALNPTGPWAKLSLVIAYATEAHLFITDMNQSPFNVGTRLTVEDFLPIQVEELNKRYGKPLKNRDEEIRFIHLVAGQPYLVRRGLYELANERASFDRFCVQADDDEGIFGDHLRRLLIALAKDADLTDVVRNLLHGEPCDAASSFYRLRSAGLILGNSPAEARLRCWVYASFLRRHLL